MSRHIPILVFLSVGFLFAAFVSFSSFADDSTSSHRIVFTGDILLSRLVEEEIKRKSENGAGIGIESLFAGATAVIGNLEGAVGNKNQCGDGIPSNLCFSIDPSQIELLKGSGFTAVVTENNHAFDLGEAGREATKKSLIENNVVPLDYEGSPIFMKVGDLTLGIVTFSMVPDASGGQVNIQSHSLRRKLRLAQGLSDLVAVYVHWGAELQDWAAASLYENANRLLDNGVEVVIGSHPHVVIEPECIKGKPVFFSLGNYLFDQKYPMTRRGLVAECVVFNEKRFFRCSAAGIQAKKNSFLPEIEEKTASEASSLTACEVNLNKPLEISGITIRAVSESRETGGKTILEGWKEGRLVWQTAPAKVISISKDRLETGDEELLFVVVERYSNIDNENAPRPYVYRVTDKGLVALWRGSALAWPLIDAAILCGDECAVCALHRGDSFLVLNPEAEETKTALYRWNGFGFSGGEFSKELAESCKVYFEGF